MTLNETSSSQILTKGATVIHAQMFTVQTKHTDVSIVYIFFNIILLQIRYINHNKVISIHVYPCKFVVYMSLQIKVATKKLKKWTQDKSLQEINYHCKLKK